MSVYWWLAACCLVVACGVLTCKPGAEQRTILSYATTPTSTAAEGSSAVEPGAPDVTNSLGMRFKLIPAGEFQMGSATNTNESPQHRAVIRRPFYIGLYEVTQAEYERVIGSNPSSLKGPRNPVETVSWVEAVEFCRRLSALPEEQAAGRVYQLPTEAEWEYACRAGGTTQFHFGDNPTQLGQYAWFYMNSGETTHPVGQKRPNGWGLYDMYGNVWEWCEDRQGEYLDEAVRRGGSWNSPAGFCTSSFSGRKRSLERYDNLGFRVVLIPSASQASR